MSKCNRIHPTSFLSTHPPPSYQHQLTKDTITHPHTHTHTSTMAPKVLFVFTSNDKLHNSEKKTGYYLPEAAHPYYTLKEAGFELVSASEKGGG